MKTEDKLSEPLSNAPHLRCCYPRKQTTPTKVGVRGGAWNHLRHLLNGGEWEFHGNTGSILYLDLYKIFRQPWPDITVITHLNVNEYN